MNTPLNVIEKLRQVVEVRLRRQRVELAEARQAYTDAEREYAHAYAGWAQAVRATEAAIEEFGSQVCKSMVDLGNIRREIEKLRSHQHKEREQATSALHTRNGCGEIVTQARAAVEQTLKRQMKFNKLHQGYQ